MTSSIRSEVHNASRTPERARATAIGQWRSQDLERVWGTEVSQGSRGRAPRGGSGGGAKYISLQHITLIFGCQTMHNFVYLAEVHEPLVHTRLTAFFPGLPE